MSTKWWRCCRWRHKDLTGHDDLHDFRGALHLLAHAQVVLKIAKRIIVSKSLAELGHPQREATKAQAEAVELVLCDLKT